MCNTLFIETKRLKMQQVVQEDQDLFLSVYSNKDVLKYISELLPIEKIQKHFQSRLPLWNKNNQQWLCFAITLKETDEKIGIVELFPKWLPYQQAEIGYMLLPAFHRNGYGCESVSAVLDFAFNKCSFNKVSATVTEGNNSSYKLLERLGFKQEGIIRENYKIADVWYNDVLYGLLKSEYTGTISLEREMFKC